ncbi:MAG: FAD-binding protein, partial [Myxococcota bacterium]
DALPISIDCSAKKWSWPLMMLTLGGLVVDEKTGAVCHQVGHPIPGLYAAGRAAVGLCSRNYVSGLSIADCVYSGRRAGRMAANPIGTTDSTQTPSASA